MSRLTTTTPLAVSADYHDALVAARRAKNWLFLLLLIGLLAQVSIFFVARFMPKVIDVGAPGEPRVNVPDVDVDARRVAETGPTTGEVERRTDIDVRTEPASPERARKAGGVLAWVNNAVVYLGTIFSIVLVLVMLLIVLIMLVGRLIGVAHTTSAFVWAVVLALILFPWQLFYDPETARPGDASMAADAREIRLDDYRWPGATFTWGELRQGVKFDDGVNKVAILRYARFAGFPLLALIILFMVQAKSGRGVKYALGEADVHVEVTGTDV